MKIADMLNPTYPMAAPVMASQEESKHFFVQLSSPPQSPPDTKERYGKPRSRFSDEEDAIICNGVAKGLTWGQISGQLPHRKRATCFNRYRTLQGIRKSRKQQLQRLQRHRSPASQQDSMPPSPTSPVSSASSRSWTLSPPVQSITPQKHLPSMIEDEDIWGRGAISIPPIASTSVTFPPMLPRPYLERHFR